MLAEIHVLVVEDSPAMARVLRRNLEARGLRVTLASNGREAWDILSAKHVDIVVTDYAMPYLDGGRLCAKMRADRRYRHTPVILLTGRGFEIDTKALQEVMRIHEVFYKPFSAIELVRSVLACAETVEAQRAAKIHTGSATAEPVASLPVSWPQS